MGSDFNEDMTPFVGARQRRLKMNTPYQDDPFAESPMVVGSNSFQTTNNSKKNLPIHKQISHGCCWPIRSCCCSNSRLADDDRYYKDDFNDSPWSCHFGTSEEDGIWMNTSDQAGTIMSMLVWLLMVYSALTITFLAQTGGIGFSLAMMYDICCSLALASHAKTTLTDPGSIPAAAVPTEEQRKEEKLNMCSQCQTFKPPLSHHCRICNRCISRMDHHCPWMNNCIGAGNMKHFILFLIYTWTCSVYALGLLGWNYFFCDTEECVFNPVLVQLVRAMTLLGIGSFLFTSSMLMNIAYGIMTGIGTIDRLKKKATNTMHTSDEEPLNLEDIFGIGPLHTWLIPTDPIFEDFDRVLGYSTPQRLLREQMKTSIVEGDYPPSVISQHTSV
mmetsp:Transcript_33170/g.50047  ORF Transcript_33170/g.50047 Transcript_33170/m.50047 type:complete len:387 (-) Transcript_33170:65-1225(-)